MSEVDRFAEFFRMLGFKLEPFQGLIVAEVLSPPPEGRVRGENCSLKKPPNARKRALLRLDS
jgi:hypothetical protein